MLHSTVDSAGHRRFTARPAWLLVGLLGMTCFHPCVLFAEPGGGAGKAARQGRQQPNAATRPGTPGTVNPNLQPGVGPRRPGSMQPFGDQTRKKAKGLGGQESKDGGAGADDDPSRLPKGFSVPQEPPEWLTTSEEWEFDPFRGDNEKDKNRDKNVKIAKFKEIAQRGELSKEDDKQLMADMIEWQLAQLTRKENREKAYEIRSRLFQTVKSSGTGRSGRPDARVFMLQTIVEKAPKLFSYHMTARLNGAILLADLSDVVEKEPEGRNPAVHFTKAHPALMALFKKDDQGHKQPDAVRIWAVDGLTRIGLLVETKPTVRGEIVDALVSQMDESAGDHEWLQWRLAESLGNMGIAYNSFKKPTVPQSLARVLVDAKRPWLVRAEAAQSLGRLPMGADIDLGLIAREIAHLAEQMADAYQKRPEQATWKLTFLKLYLAFKPANDDEAKKDKGLLTQVTSKGALSAHKKAVQDAYDVVLPIVQGIVNPPQNIDQAVVQLKDWLNKNPPRNVKIEKNEDPIINLPQAGAPAERPPVGGSAAAG